MKFIISRKALLFAGLLAVISPQVTLAGPIIIGGDDANDHGGVSGGVNQTGWLYMQRALENLGPNVTATSKVVTVLGTDGNASNKALASITSAFNLSSLVGAGWTLNVVGSTAAAITNALNNLSTSTSGILYISTDNQATGDLASIVNGQAALNAQGVAIDNFVKAGGGLFTQTEDVVGGYGWLTSLIPGLTISSGGNGLALTAAGSASFPGLTDADLSAGPWHNNFQGNLGVLQVLATGTDNGGIAGRNVIIGGNVAGAGLTAAVPEPGTFVAAFIGGLVGLGALVRRRRASDVAVAA